jgi:serine/threonine-protein kinase
VHELEAWMPERIAAYKVLGFVHDVGGELIESVPGRIRVRLGGRGSFYTSKNQSALSWLGIGRKSGLMELELNLERSDSGRDNLLRVVVAMRSLHGKSTTDPDWRARCEQIFCDLRGYLMGKSGAVNDVMASARQRQTSEE